MNRDGNWTETRKEEEIYVVSGNVAGRSITHVKIGCSSIIDDEGPHLVNISKSAP